MFSELLIYMNFIINIFVLKFMFQIHTRIMKIEIKKPTQEKLEELRQIGNSLIDDFKNHDLKKNTDWQNYMLITKLYTYFFHNSLMLILLH